MNYRRLIHNLLMLALLAGAAIACTKVPGDGIDTDKPDDPYADWGRKSGAAYVFDGSVIPEILLTVRESEWNRMLKEFDRDPATNEHFCASVAFKKGEEVTRIDSIAFRLKGNTSRRRPEGWSGQMHQKDNADWHHFHMGMNFRYYWKDIRHTVHGQRKLHLKYFKEDPSYAREIYCFDLFRRFGVWTAPMDIYCRLRIHVEGDANPAYYGVYQMIEPYDADYVKVREDQFGGNDGFLWKCRYGASLNSVYASFGYDGGQGQYSNCVYELKTSTEEFDAAKEQLKDFILKLTGKTGESFDTWISTHCDVELLLRTYAVTTATGMWDDYWNNSNNFYIYFDAKDKLDYKFYLLPYDYDNTLGTSGDCGVQKDSGRHSPLSWGKPENVLISKIIEIPRYRQMYIDALKELADPANSLFYHTASMSRIRSWQAKVASYVKNDTGEDCEIKDRPASWSNHQEYRLLTNDSNNNFFMVKESVIEKL